MVANVAVTIYLVTADGKMVFFKKQYLTACLTITKHSVKEFKPTILTRIMSNKKFPEPPAPPD